MKKIVLFAFNGDFMCFIHVLLNALDMKEKGHEVKIVIEGSATKLIPELKKKGNPMYTLYQKTKDSGLIDGVCKACSNKMGTLEAARAEGFKLLDDMNGQITILLCGFIIPSLVKNFKRKYYQFQISRRMKVQSMVDK